MLALTTLSDASDAPLWGWQGWALLLLVLVALRAAYEVGKVVGEDRTRRAMLRHPAIRARHADKQFEQVA